MLSRHGSRYDRSRVGHASPFSTCRLSRALLQRRRGILGRAADPAQQRSDAPLQERDQPDVEETPLEEEQEGQREVHTLVQREPDGGGEISSEGELEQRLRREQGTVLLPQPTPILSQHARLGRAREPGLVPDQRLDHGLALVHAHPDAEGHDERQVLDALPAGHPDLPLAGDVEEHHAHGRRPEERQIEQEHLVPPVLEADHHAHRHEHREQDHQRISEVRGEVEERLELHLARQVAAEDAREELARGLDAALRPPVLLRLERVHLHRHFSRRNHFRQVDEAPARELRAVAQVQILGQRVVLPAPGVLDGGAPPDTSGPVEVEEASAAVARGVLDDEVAVEKDGLRLREVRVLAVQVLPPDLHHSDVLVGEEVHRAQEEVGGGDEVRIEYRDQLAARDLEPLLQGAGLVAAAVVSVEVGDVQTLLAQLLDPRAGDALRLVRGLVEDLDLQPVSRVLDERHGLDQTLDHLQLVLQCELDDEAQTAYELPLRRRQVALVLVEQVGHHVPMRPVDG